MPPNSKDTDSHIGRRLKLRDLQGVGIHDDGGGGGDDGERQGEALPGLVFRPGPAHELLGELVLLLPLAAFHQQIDVRSVGAILIAEDAQRGLFKRAPQGGRMRQGVRAHEVHVQRFIRGGRERRGFRQQLDLQRQEIPEDSRERDHHINAGSSQQLKWGELRAHQAAITVKAWLCAHESQGLTNLTQRGIGVDVGHIGRDACIGALGAVQITTL